jgi:CYTH domain-containing protein
MHVPKYALVEHERRFIVPAANCPALGVARLIEDLYLRDSRLRLRAITDERTGERTFKLCKKYLGRDRISGPIVNIYLTAMEHEALARQPGAWLRKRRHAIDGGFSLDQFEGPLEGLLICEAEAESREAALALSFPAWVGREVTDDLAFTGGELARTTAAELAGLLVGRA